MPFVEDWSWFRTDVTSVVWRFSRGFAKARTPKVKKNAKKDATRENSMIAIEALADECEQVLLGLRCLSKVPVLLVLYSSPWMLHHIFS